jgi:hypothetical protein
MRLFTILVFIIGIFVSSFTLAAQESMMEKLKGAQERACTNGTFFYGDDKAYNLNNKQTDPSKAQESELYKAIGSQKQEFFIATCTEDNNVKLAIYIKPTNAKFYYKVFSGTQDATGMATLDGGNINLMHTLIPDPQKQFADDINKLEINFLNDGVFVEYSESFFEQSKGFDRESSRNGSDRIEMIIPFVAPPEKPEKDGTQEDWDEYYLELKEHEASLLELEKPFIERLQKVGYTYSMLFIKVEGKKMGSFSMEDLRSYGVNLSGLDKFPKDQPIELLFIGVMAKKGHYELDIVSILRGGEKGKDLIYFEQTNYSKKVPIRLGDTPSGSKDNIMLIYEYCQYVTDCKPSIFISRKASRNGLDVIDISDTASVRSAWGEPDWTMKPNTSADFVKDGQKLNLNATFIRSNSVNLNLTEDESAAVILVIKQKVSKIQKQYVKELLGKDIEGE